MFTFLQRFITPSNSFVILLVIIAAWLIVPNIQQLQEKLGFDTVSSLRVEKEQLQNVVDVMAQTQQHQEKVIEQQVMIQKSAIDTVETVHQQEKKIQQTVQKIIKKHQVQPIKPMPAKGIDTTVAQAQIDTLWDAFHTLNQQGV